MRILLILLLTVFVFSSSDAQTEFEYSFENCGLSETTGSLSDITVFGNPDCVCGPVNDGFFFDDASEYMEMPKPGSLLTQDNYSFSFYIRPSGGGGPIQQVFTNETACGDRDSLFSIQYFSSIQTITVRLADFGATVGFVEAALDNNKCWQQVTLVKSGRILQLFINGTERAEFAGNLPINIFSDEPILVAQSKCGMGNNVTKFEGALDEITWYNRALTPSEVLQNYFPVDEILSSDTLIFEGDQFIPRVTKSCANSIQWQPATGLSNANIFQPTIGPLTTQEYDISFSYQGCTASDNITVVVVNEDDVDCESILLPTAFTPNGDNLNDEFGISNAFIIEELLQFDIMDRQGNTLFSALQPEDKWTGEYRGKIMSSGIYVYKLSYLCKNEEFTRTGSFNILR